MSRLRTGRHQDFLRGIEGHQTPAGHVRRRHIAVYKLSPGALVFPPKEVVHREPDRDRRLDTGLGISDAKTLLNAQRSGWPGREFREQQ